MSTSTPELVFSSFKNPTVDGWPPDGEWALCLFGDGQKPEIFVGGYDKERHIFYANYGLGGAVLDQEDVAAWCLLYDYQWKGVEWYD